MEFVCSMWNLLTLPESQLGALAYLMKDPSGVLRISRNYLIIRNNIHLFLFFLHLDTEVKVIVESMHHKKVESSSTLSGFFQELRNNYGTEISIQEFCKWTTLNPSIITPLLMLQLKFRKSILGDSVWQKKAKERAEDKEMNTVEYIRKLHNLIKSKIKEQLKKIELNKKEKSFKSSKSASEKNIARKHSVLLEAFNLKPQQSTKSSKLTPLSMDAEEDLSSPIKSPSRRKFDSPSPLSQKNTSKSFDEENSPTPLSRKKSRKNNSLKFEVNDNDNPPKLSRKESKNKLDSTSRKGSSKNAATSNTEGENKKEKRPKSAKRK